MTLTDTKKSRWAKQSPNGNKSYKASSSVIGPILFILYIYDINKYIPDEAQLKKYADDILAYLIGNYDRTLPQRIADGVDKWCSDNQMRLNTNKCKIISVLPKNTQAAPTVNLHGQILE